MLFVPAPLPLLKKVFAGGMLVVCRVWCWRSERSICLHSVFTVLCRECWFFQGVKHTVLFSNFVGVSEDFCHAVANFVRMLGRNSTGGGPLIVVVQGRSSDELGIIVTSFVLM